MLKLENILKQYVEGDQPHVVLDHLNMEIAAGEIIILYGKSGSGKSTLLNIISGIDIPDSGNVAIDDINLAQLSERERTLFRRNRMGFIFQFFNLIPTLTVRENLQLPLELKQSPDPTSKINQILEEVGISAKADKYPDILSGGEQQRVAIARALVHDPDIILADEPTGNLDFETSRQIVDLLDRVVKQKGKTMIMVTHSRDVIGLADHVYNLRDGKLIDNEQETERA